MSMTKGKNRAISRRAIRRGQSVAIKRALVRGEEPTVLNKHAGRLARYNWGGGCSGA